MIEAWSHEGIVRPLADSHLANAPLAHLLTCSLSSLPSKIFSVVFKPLTCRMIDSLIKRQQF